MTTKSGECGRNVASINRNHSHSGGLVGSSDGEKNSGNSSSKYRGVRKRNWGKWVSEIRLPNSRERIWLGSFDSPEKAARAFDAALFCLRGSAAKFNFPDNPPHIPGGTFLSPAEIQGVATEYANSEPRVGQSNSCCWSSELQQVDCSSSQSPSYLVSEAATGLDMGHMAVDTDTSVFDQYSRMGSGWTDNRVPDFGIFPGFDDLCNEFFLQPLPQGAPDYEEACPEYTTTSFLWNF